MPAPQRPLSSLDVLRGLLVASALYEAATVVATLLSLPGLSHPLAVLFGAARMALNLALIVGDVSAVAELAEEWRSELRFKVLLAAHVAAALLFLNPFRLPWQDSPALAGDLLRGLDQLLRLFSIAPYPALATVEALLWLGLLGYLLATASPDDENPIEALHDVWLWGRDRLFGPRPTGDRALSFAVLVLVPLTTVAALTGLGWALRVHPGNVPAALSPLTADCAALDEGSCIVSPDCAPRRGPSCPGCKDLRYRGCQPMNDESRRLRLRLKTLCAQTGGRWAPDRYDKLSSCDCSLGPYFDPVAGCLNPDTDCAGQGNRLYRPGDACEPGDFPDCQANGRVDRLTCVCAPSTNWFGASPPPYQTPDFRTYRFRQWGLRGHRFEGCKPFTWP